MASSSNSSCSPSSSAVTIPIPGKSILKRPPPTQQSLFSRIARLLPAGQTAQPTTNDDSKPLKRAHFILPEIATVYPISSVNPPSTPTLKEEKKAIEDREAERRKRVLRGNVVGPGINDTEPWWNLDKVESFYRECCAGCEVEPDPAITKALKHAAPSNPRSVDFSGVQITLTSASILSDVFTIEWGLRKVTFRECDLDEHTLKPILHSLLIPGSLSFLSVASNRRLKAPAFRLIGAYVSEAKSLQFLDLSQNTLEKKSVEYIIAALATAPDPGLVSLRLDDCMLRPAALETLSRAVRTSSLRNISLRHNRINATGAVALALMIRDYPDVVPAPVPSPAPSLPPSPISNGSSLPLHALPSHPIPPPRPGHPLPPPPRHPPTGPQTTYTPYVPRSRRGHVPPVAPNPLSPTGQPIPIITSSTQGGVTTRHTGTPVNGDSAAARHHAGPSAALLDKVRALDALPRVGALRTLDLKGNDLKGGITYIAQVLKRNRTLKVLNLSENKLDVQCLVVIAEALKYNSSLETLDLSKNPCCGPGLEGIQSLRTAFTLNTALKRLFLASTSMTSAGAIALAEFLPESTSLLHLDLTENTLDIAGVMALSSGLKANHVMRCLDLNIPPGDEEFAKMCRDILNSCVRNTEEAERSTQSPNGQNNESGRGLGKGVWGMIDESELARTIRLGEEQKIESDVAVRARAYITRLKDIISSDSSPSGTSSPSTTSNKSPEPAVEVANKAKAVVIELTGVIQETTDPVRLEELLAVNDELTVALSLLPPPARPTLTLQGLGLNWDDIQSPGVDAARWKGSLNGDGLLSHSSSADASELSEDEIEPATPKIDKGKGRAEPEPEEPEKVLSPTFLITESEDEDDEGQSRYITEDGENFGAPSPTDRSRSWVEEEGEVFRKGTILLGPEEMEGEFPGEELRKELLEAMVERPPPRPMVDEFGLEIPNTPNGTIPEQDVLPSSPTVNSEPNKPPPRPYVSRSRSSSSSILSVISPGLGSPSAQQVESPTHSPMSPTLGSNGRSYLHKSRSSSSIESS